MFGVPLTDLCNRESSTVPLIIRRIVKHIEDVGLDQEGVYRINGNTRIIDKLKMDFDKGNLAMMKLFLGPLLLLFCVYVSCTLNGSFLGCIQTEKLKIALGTRL